MRQQAKRESRPGRLLTGLFTRKLPLETETTTYVLVSVLDYIMTYVLLMYGGQQGHRYFESNPVASYFIYSWGLKTGMLTFKLSVVTFVCLLAQVIAIRKPHLGRAVLLIGTVVTSAVVIYSLLLFLRHG